MKPFAAVGIEGDAVLETRLAGERILLAFDPLDLA
jgi:hypothetical protein